MNLVQRRKELDLTQADVAKAIGWSRVWYNRLENNPTAQKRIPADVAVKLADVLRVSVSEVVS